VIVVVGILVAALIIGWRRGSRRLAAARSGGDVRKESFLSSSVWKE
jgi:hypothetical protein